MVNVSDLAQPWRVALHRETTPAAAALVVVLSACGGPGQTGLEADFTVRDSAGIRIVEYDGTPTPTHSITLSGPLYRHGHREGDYLFTLPRTGALQLDGSAVIGDMMNSEIVVTGSDGALRSILASEGQGPNEVLRGMEIRVLAQDTVVVHDHGNRRVTVFENGDVDRSVPIRASRIRMSGVDAEGRVLFERTGSDLQGPLMRFDMEADVYDTVGVYDHAPSGPVNRRPL